MVGLYLRRKMWFSCLQDNRQVKLQPNPKGLSGFPSLGVIIPGYFICRGTASAQ